MCILKQVWLFVDFIRSDSEWSTFFHFCIPVFKALFSTSSPCPRLKHSSSNAKNLFSAILCVCCSVSIVSLIWSVYCLCNFSILIMIRRWCGPTTSATSLWAHPAQGPSRLFPKCWLVYIVMHTHTTATTFCLLMNCITLDCDAHRTQPEVEFVTAVTAGSSVKFLPAVKFLHFHPFFCAFSY